MCLTFCFYVYFSFCVYSLLFLFLLSFVFFFFKQKTAYEMRISDWSSDVCSSDLHTLQSIENATPQTSGLNAIEAKGLRKIYRAANGQPAKEALKGIDLAVPQGSIFGLLGPNGAGKSTFINILAGLVMKTEGDVSIWGFDIAANPRQARAYICVMPQRLSVAHFLRSPAVLVLPAGPPCEARRG